MSDYITRSELDDAIAAVTEDIRETEQRLDEKFTNTVRWEIGRVDKHLSDQDESLKWIQRFALGALLTVIAALIYLVH